MLGLRLSTDRPQAELLHCPNTLRSFYHAVFTLLSRLKHRRHHIEMQSLCFANGALATEPYRVLYATFRKVVTGTCMVYATRHLVPVSQLVIPY